MLSKDIKSEVAKKFAIKEGDTGSPEVQVALLTSRINHLAEHFGVHKKDYHSKRGLMQMIGQRRSLLKYLARINEGRYQKLIQELGLRK